jgi:hypothetical protein
MAPVSASPDDGAAIAHVRTRLLDAAARLSEAHARTEALAEYVPAARVLVMPRPERMRRVGSVWRLGVLLLAAEAGDEPLLYATGSITRAHEPGRTTYIAASAERRRQLRVAAYRGRFGADETVNFDATPIAVDGSLVGASGPLTVRDGSAYVRWSTTDANALVAFDDYLTERVDLLMSPPEGA